eukprot:jgi/Bigna1/72502/fgenesh1_pg.20_\
MGCSASANGGEKRGGGGEVGEGQNSSKPQIVDGKMASGASATPENVAMGYIETTDIPGFEVFAPPVLRGEVIQDGKIVAEEKGGTSAKAQWALDFGEFEMQLRAVLLCLEPSIRDRVPQYMEMIRSGGQGHLAALIKQLYGKYHTKIEIPMFNYTRLKVCMEEIYRDKAPEQLEKLGNELANVTRGTPSLQTFADNIQVKFGIEAARNLSRQMERKLTEVAGLPPSKFEPTAMFWNFPSDHVAWTKLNAKTSKAYEQWVALRMAISSLRGTGRVIPCEFYGPSRPDRFHRNLLGKLRGFSDSGAFAQWEKVRLDQAPSSRKWKDVDPRFTTPEDMMLNGDTTYRLTDDAGTVRPFSWSSVEPRIEAAKAESKAKYTQAWEVISDHEKGPSLVSEAASKCTFKKKGGNGAGVHFKYSGWAFADVKLMMPEHVAAQTLQLYEQALVATGPLFVLACKCAASVRGLMKGTAVQWSIKKPLRYLRKVYEKYGRMAKLTDVARCSIVFDTCEEVANAITWLLKNAEVERIKDRISKPADGGYRQAIHYNSLFHQNVLFRDVLVNVRIDSHLCEVQLHLSAMANVKKHGGHLLFRWLRVYDMSARLRNGLPQTTTTEKDSQGRAQGLGHWENAMGDRFFGSFKDGEFDEGMYTNPNGFIYAGKFRNNRPGGLGRFSSPDGTELRSSQQTLIFTDNESQCLNRSTSNFALCMYFGEHQNGRPNGLGQIFFPGKISHLATPYNFDGEVKNGEPAGHGVLFMGKGSAVSGKFGAPMCLLNDSKEAQDQGREIGKKIFTSVSNAAQAQASAACKTAALAKKAVAQIDESRFPS